MAPRLHHEALQRFLADNHDPAEGTFQRNDRAQDGEGAEAVPDEHVGQLLGLHHTDHVVDRAGEADVRPAEIGPLPWPGQRRG